MRDKRRFFKLIVCVVGFGLFGACQTAPTNTSQNANPTIVQTNINATMNSTPLTANADKAKVEKGGHEHESPHGGTLVAFGEEFAHLELVLDAAAGKLTAYALDGEAENAVRLAQTEIEIEVKKPMAFIVKLNAVENALSGEKVGATSEFSGQAEQLKNLKTFDGAIKSINIKAKEFQNVEFDFPNGNEHD